MILLGSTGSIGVNTLKIVKEFDLDIEVLVAGSNYKLLNQQIKEFKPKKVVVKNSEIAKKVEFENVLCGEENILRVIEESDSDLVVNALVGSSGINPTLKSVELGKKLALANKESLVVMGAFLDTKNIVPIDSEHFGLWYLQNGRKIDSMVITASGGALRDFDNLKNVSIKDVLNHPNWSMGAKITVDSATMVNKLFELLEARWLFDTNKIDAVIERNSIIHSLVNFVDGSTTAHIADTDMRLPIAFAILGEVNKQITPFVNLTEIGTISFDKIDASKYPVWEIKDKLLERPELGVVLHSVNEIVNKKFLDGEISFLDISEIILKEFKVYENQEIMSSEDILNLSKEIGEKYGY